MLELHHMQYLVGTHTNIIGSSDCLVYLEYTLFHSLKDNRIGSEGATALADALTVNENLKILK